MPARETKRSADQVILGLAVLATVATAWFALAQQGGLGTAPPGSMWMPHAQPPSVLGVSSAAVMWLVMMTAMMLPSVMPWLWAFSAVADGGPAPARFGRVFLFALGYLTIWGGFSVVAGIVQVGLVQNGLLDALHIAARTGLGAVALVAAGIYELTPAKAACLKHCRSPMSFLLSSWRSGASGAFRMGAEHGAFCVGCCWAVMVLSFVLGVMNLVWMAILTIVLCLEKLAPRGRTIGRTFGAALIAWGAWVLLMNS